MLRLAAVRADRVEPRVPPVPVQVVVEIVGTVAVVRVLDRAALQVQADLVALVDPAASVTLAT
jgi:hypothetical protein